jgi:hypothetical protein
VVDELALVFLEGTLEGRDELVELAIPPPIMRIFLSPGGVTKSTGKFVGNSH